MDCVIRFILHFLVVVNLKVKLEQQSPSFHDERPIS